MLVAPIMLALRHLLRRGLLAAIRLYQRHLSPHKGFQCAYRLHTGRASCSHLGYRAVRWHGLRQGLALLRQRTALCGVAHRRHGGAAAGAGAGLALRSQRGDCDLGCDAGDCNHFSGCCDCGSCDWRRSAGRSPSRARGRQRGDQYVYLPPHGKRAERRSEPP